MKKAFRYIGFCLLFALFIYVMVSFIVNKDGTMYWINKVIDWLNKPLPIIGITTFGVLYFIWKCFVAIRYGKGAIAELDKREKDLEQREKAFEERIESMQKAQNLAIANHVNKVAKGFQLSTNKRISDYGKELINYGEETTNSATNTK